LRSSYMRWPASSGVAAGVSRRPRLDEVRAELRRRQAHDSTALLGRPELAIRPDPGRDVPGVGASDHPAGQAQAIQAVAPLIAVPFAFWLQGHKPPRLWYLARSWRSAAWLCSISTARAAGRTRGSAIAQDFGGTERNQALQSDRSPDRLDRLVDSASTDRVSRGPVAPSADLVRSAWMTGHRAGAGQRPCTGGCSVSVLPKECGDTCEMDLRV